MEDTLTNNFGLQNINENIKQKINFLPNNLINIIEFHRDLDTFDINKEYYLYTGRGPSVDSFHIGHLPALLLTLELQKYIKEKIYFMISDDEKIFRDNIDRNIMEKNVISTIEQLNKIGFTHDNTIFHINSNGINKEHYNILIQLLSMVNVNQLNHIFGEKGNIGEYFYPLYQILPCFLNKNKQCIIIAGKDQDPFFRLARDLAGRLGYKKPIIIYTKSIPGLDGSEKMSTSVISSLPIFLNDTPKIINDKIFKIKQVGAGTLDELFNYGANLSIDIPYILISIFDNSDNIILIKKAYTIGILDNEELEKLIELVSEKGVQTRKNKSMLTSFGIRTYLSKLIIKSIL